jgi:precorrin-6B C5,15-methyltransferase / cobalt-precorrin-6B C5,C15-methyltransferase
MRTNLPCPSLPIHVLGLGQDLVDLSLTRERLIREADLIVAGERIHAAFPEVRAERAVLKAPLERILEQLALAAAEGLRVVVLVGGDPCFFGIGPLLAHRLGRERVVLHPGPTTVQAAAAKLGIAWQDVSVVSLHGREDHAPLFNHLSRKARVCAYTDEKNTPSVIAGKMLERGAENFAMWVFEDLGSPGQRWTRFSLQEVREQSFSPLNLVLLERLRDPEIWLTMGMDDDAYIHEQGLITKRVVRAAALAALRLEPMQMLWDLGAGCGSLGIEAGLLLPGGEVLAVERKGRRAAMILENVRRTHSFWVRVVHGAMPGCLEELPEPDRIFLGGGLGNDQADGSDVLETAWSRLKPGGRLVAAAVLLDSLHRVRTFLEQCGHDLEITQVQAAQGAPLAGDLHLCAQNPVFLVCGQKPEAVFEVCPNRGL